MPTLYLLDVFEDHDEPLVKNFTIHDHQINGKHCQRTYDFGHCWPIVAFNTTVELPCPSLHIGEYSVSNSNQLLKKHCNSLGEWEPVNPIGCIDDNIITDFLNNHNLERELEILNTYATKYGFEDLYQQSLNAKSGTSENNQRNQNLKLLQAKLLKLSNNGSVSSSQISVSLPGYNLTQSTSSSTNAGRFLTTPHPNLLNKPSISKLQTNPCNNLNRAFTAVYVAANLASQTTNKIQSLASHHDFNGHYISYEPVFNRVMLVTKYILLLTSVLSIVSCLTGIVIYKLFDSLNCDRNRIHCNLFISFLIYHIMTLLKMMTVHDLTISQHSQLKDNNKIFHYENEYSKNSENSMKIEIYDSDHDVVEYLTCPKIEALDTSLIIWNFYQGITVMLWYSHLSNYFWMLCEALYLHRQITAESMKKNIEFYKLKIIGWVIPAILTSILTVITYFRTQKLLVLLYEAATSGIITVSQYMDKAADTYRFDHLHNSYVSYLVVVPILIALLINCFIIGRVVRIIIKVQKTLKHSEHIDSNTVVKKAIRATAMLIPLLGLTEFLILYNPWHESKNMFDAFHISLSLILRSLGGLTVVTLYCFSNRDVINAIKQYQQRKNEISKISMMADTKYSLALTARMTSAMAHSNLPEKPKRQSLTSRFNQGVKISPRQSTHDSEINYVNNDLADHQTFESHFNLSTLRHSLSHNFYKLKNKISPSNSNRRLTVSPKMEPMVRLKSYVSKDEILPFGQSEPKISQSISFDTSGYFSSHGEK